MNGEDESSKWNIQDHLSKGAKVELFVNGGVVGTAFLHVPRDGICSFERKLHGTGLDTVERKKEYLIVITGIVVSQGKGDVTYPYTCPGQEGTPTSLKDTFAAGVYAWDAKTLRTA